MKQENQFNVEDSLRLIDKMIRSAQESVEDSSFYYLVWGWAVFIAAAIQYTLIQMNNQYHFIGWTVLMPLTAVVTVIYSIRENKKQPKTKSYVHELISYAVIAFIASLGIVLFFMSRLQLNAFPMVMVTYATWLFISGGALKFKPLMAGGIVNWIFAAAGFFVSFQTQVIFLALAVLLGYIIPGHLLRNKYKNAAKQVQAV